MSLSADVYYEYVVPYAHVNEARYNIFFVINIRIKIIKNIKSDRKYLVIKIMARSNWRAYLAPVVARILSDHLDIEDTSLGVEEVVRSLR